MVKGKVYLIGAGPGRPDLITVRGLNVLKEADVILYDYLVDPRVLKAAKAGAELLCADELGKKRYADAFSQAQGEINRMIVKKAVAGKKVARLKNGDPSIFGRLSQEVEALVENGIEFEIVPGVTAGSAAAAYTGVPLTDRRFSSSVVFVTGHEDPNKSESLIDWRAVAALTTIVLYMAVENLDKIVARLLAAGRHKLTSALIVSRAGDFRQRMARGTLANIAAKASRAGISAPAVVIIGRVTAGGRGLDWFSKNRRILFTGLSEERYFLKGSYFHLPLIEIKSAENYQKLDRQIVGIRDFDWIVFSSRFGVEYLFRRLLLLGFDARRLAGIKIAAIGDSTRRKLNEFGVNADLVPKRESSLGLLARFKQLGIKGERIFFPRSDIADKGLTRGLKALGAEVTPAIAYRNVMPKNLPDLDLKFFYEIYFSSPSAVRNFKKKYGKVPGGVRIRWIGEITKRELLKQRMI